MPNYNLITGKLQNLQSVALSDDEKKEFDDAFKRIVARINNIDPELAADFQNEHDFYQYAASVAKAYFSSTNLPFVPDEPTSGTFGMRELIPQDMQPPSIFTGTITASFHSWVQSLSVGASAVWTDLFGSSASPIKPSNLQSYHSLLAFHQLISWQPGTRIVQMRHNVNGYQYPGVSVEHEAKITKAFKPFKVIPLEGEFLIHPTGYWNTRVALEKDVFADAETYTEEIGIMGICFGEFGYLNAEIN